jgi:hypothetical protein
MLEFATGPHIAILGGRIIVISPAAFRRRADLSSTVRKQATTTSQIGAGAHTKKIR